ncbi:hypothetical protein NY547_15320 [Cnuibacter physcomitrellae]|uniref:hypothetical protein n=1 Tax=Cnuibacter physcomitrellae TaxID=1619308 RepID=UPI002175BD31|nr:hypothetical protein [Cnuibacter physcomitrellae]MCS5498620.1 hypothetical protein [Cnuibacter physcomitrellae]
MTSDTIGETVVLDEVVRIQDYFVTRTTLLIASRAEPREWQAVFEAAQRASGDEWRSRDGLLFDVTLARWVIATQRITGEGWKGARTAATAFTEAVSAGAAPAARSMWKAEFLAGPTRLTIRLLEQIYLLDAASHATPALEQLPAAYPSVVTPGDIPED